MTEPDLDDLIDELRSTIDASTSLSDQDRERLAGVVRRVEAAADPEDDDDEGLLEHLDETLSRFEAEHVGLVAVINRIANALSAGGI